MLRFRITAATDGKEGTGDERRLRPNRRETASPESHISILQKDILFVGFIAKDGGNSKTYSEI